MQMAMSSLHNYIRMYVDLVLLVQRTQTKRNGGMVCDLRRFASKNRIRYLCKLHKLIPITIGLNSMIVLTSPPIGAWKCSYPLLYRKLQQAERPTNQNGPAEQQTDRKLHFQ